MRDLNMKVCLSVDAFVTVNLVKRMLCLRSLLLKKINELMNELSVDGKQILVVKVT